jgi:hypothetical protein
MKQPTQERPLHMPKDNAKTPATQPFAPPNVTDYHALAASDPDMAEFFAEPIWTPMAIYTGSGLAKPGKIPMRYDVANNKSLAWGFRKTTKGGKEASEAVSCAEVLEQLEDLDAMADTSKLRGELRGFLRGYAQVPDDAEILHWEPSFHGGGKFGSFDLDDTLTPTGKRKKWAAQIMEASKGVRWFTTVSGKGVRGVFRMPSDPEEAARIRALCNTRNEKNNAGIGTIWGEFWSFSAKPAPEDKGGPIEWDEATLMAVVEHHGGLPKRKAKPGAVARVAHNREPWDGAPDFHFDRVCRWIDKTPQGIADALDATENTDQDIGWCFGVGRAAIEHLVHTTREREFEEDGTPIEPESLPTSAMDPAAWAIVKPALGRFLGRQPNPTPNAQRDLIKMVLAADVGGLWEFAGGTELFRPELARRDGTARGDGSDPRGGLRPVRGDRAAILRSTRGEVPRQGRIGTRDGDQPGFCVREEDEGRRRGGARR